MDSVLIVLHLVIVVALATVVLLQRSEGGGLGMGGGGSPGGFFTGRGQANLLTRTTAILGALFFVTSITLSWIAGVNHRTGGSLIDQVAPQSPAAPGAPAPGGSVLDQLRRQQGGTPAAPATPSAPSAPAPQ